MDGNRTTRDAIETLMQSDLADWVIHPGQEIVFAQALDTLIEGLDPDRYRTDGTYLRDRFDEFLNTAEDLGWFDEASFEWGADRTDMQSFVEEVHAVVGAGIKARLDAEERSAGQDGFSAPTPSIRHRLQDLLHTVKALVFCLWQLSQLVEP